VPYAERHNEGLKGMPQRQFMGPSEDFDEKLSEHVEDELDKIFN
jgi:phage gpG-like protein